MPKITRKCYTLPPLISSEVSSTLLDTSELALILSRFSGNTSDYINEALLRFVGSRGSYTYKAQLIQLLLIITAHLKKEGVDEDQKRVVADKILEGINGCAPGFHDRLNNIILGLTRPRNIDQLLGNIRHSIVESVALQVTDGQVNTHNSFFVAAERNYGVRPINPRDIYIRGLASREMDAIKKAFAEKYQAINILNDLQVSMEGELRLYYGYQGKKTIEDPYNLGQITKTVDFINSILGTSLAEADIFTWQWNEDRVCDVPVDINWGLIQNLLRKALRDKHYIIFSEEEEQFFDALYAPDESAFTSLLNEARFVEMIHTLKFIQYPSIFRSLLTKNRVAPLLSRRTATMTKDEFLNYFSLLQSFFLDDSDLKKNYLKEAARAWLSKEENKRRIFDTELDEQLAMIFVYSELSDAELDRLISHALPKLQRLLFLSLKYGSDLLPRLLTRLGSLEPRDQALTLTIKDSDGFNIMMLAAEKEPRAIPKLLEVMASHPLAVKKELFATKGMGYNALMLAVERRSSAIIQIIEFITSVFEPAIQQMILTAQTPGGANTLMLGVYHNPSAVPALLNTIRPLDKATQNEIFTVRTVTSGSNALMLAARYQSGVLAQLLNHIIAFPASELVTRRAIFTMKTTTDGDNALLLTIQHQPSNVSGFLTAIQALDPETQESILVAVNNHGLNALMKVMQYQPNAMTQLLEVIKRLDKSTQQEIFLAKNRGSGSNALMLAVRYQPESLSPLLTAMSDLLPRVKKEILKSQTLEGTNALMLAIQYQPTSVSKILEVITDIEEEVLTAQTTPHGLNPLMLAILYQPALIPQLLTFIESLDPRIQKAIFTQVSMNGYNILALLTSHQPIYIPRILTTIRSFPPDVQRTIFTARTNTGANAFMVAAQYQPDVLTPFLDVMNDYLDEILTVKMNNGANALMITMRYQPIAAIQLLDVIKTRAHDVQKTIFSEEMRSGTNVLMLAATVYPAVIPRILSHMRLLPPQMQKNIANCKIRSGETSFTFLFRIPHLFDISRSSLRHYNIDVQLEILKEPAKVIPSVNTYRQELLASAMTELRSGSALEQGIERQLRTHATPKQEAIIIALYEIKYAHPHDSDTAIIAALDDRGSALYGAFNVGVYIPLCLFGRRETPLDSLRRAMPTPGAAHEEEADEAMTEESPFIVSQRLMY